MVNNHPGNGKEGKKSDISSINQLLHRFTLTLTWWEDETQVAGNVKERI